MANAITRDRSPVVVDSRQKPAVVPEQGKWLGLWWEDQSMLIVALIQFYMLLVEGKLLKRAIFIPGKRTIEI